MDNLPSLSFGYFYENVCTKGLSIAKLNYESLNEMKSNAFEIALNSKQSAPSPKKSVEKSVEPAIKFHGPVTAP